MTTQWPYCIAYFFGGAFFGNTIPHLVSGYQGRAFQSVFSKPRGEAFSSSRTNFSWGFTNLVVAYLLVFQVGAFDVRAPWHALPFLTGMFAIGMRLSRRFGRFNGGNHPESVPRGS